eukprot:5738400-Pleurochrysis_carterae.AAC.3
MKSRRHCFVLGSKSTLSDDHWSPLCTLWPFDAWRSTLARVESEFCCCGEGGGSCTGYALVCPMVGTDSCSVIDLSGAPNVVPGDGASRELTCFIGWAVNCSWT